MQAMTGVAVVAWAAALLYIAADRQRFATIYPETRERLTHRAYLPATAAISAATTLTALLFAPSAALAAWLILSTIGTHCVIADAFTGYVPASWCHIGWASLAIATTATASTGHLDVAIRTTIAALTTTFLFWLIWRISRGGIGFGDVRYAPLPAAATAAISTTTWTIALITGALIGAIVALTLAHWTKSSPYTPSLWAGAIIILLATA